MSETVDACPNCGSSTVQKIASSGVDRFNPDAKKHICNACGARFDTPERRDTVGHTDTQKGMARALIDASPDDFPV